MRGAGWSCPALVCSLELAVEAWLSRARRGYMNWPVIIVVAIIVIAVVVLIAGYNGLVQKRLRIDEAFAQIEVQLKRRHDLIPNLVNAVKGDVGSDKKSWTDVTTAGAAPVAAGAQGPTQQAAAENALTGSL